MAVVAYLLCVACMFGITGKASDPPGSVVGIGHGFIRAPAYLGAMGFKLAIPLLAIFPTALVAFPFRLLYPSVPESRDMSMANFAMIITATVVAFVNASIYSAN